MCFSNGCPPKTMLHDLMKANKVCTHVTECEYYADLKAKPEPVCVHQCQGERSYILWKNDGVKECVESCPKGLTTFKNNCLES